MNGYIYKITNEINNKVYIGKTLHSIEERFNTHKKDSGRRSYEQRPLYKAMNKYGVDKFHIELVEEAPLESLSERECYWIEFFNSYGSTGYNATKGGDGKQLYDYDAIVKGFLSGKLVKELAQEFECSEDTISNALKLANINSKANAFKNIYKGICAKTLDGKLVASFESRAQAVSWLQENEYTKSNDIDNISATIGRVANGKRKSAYGLIWENI